MARRYVRDRRGRFASKGGGGGQLGKAKITKKGQKARDQYKAASANARSATKQAAAVAKRGSKGGSPASKSEQKYWNQKAGRAKSSLTKTTKRLSGKNIKDKSAGAVQGRQNMIKQGRQNVAEQVSIGPRLASGKNTYTGSAANRREQAANWRAGGTGGKGIARQDGRQSAALWDRTKAKGSTTTSTKKTGVLGLGKRQAKDYRVKAKPKKAAKPANTIKTTRDKKIGGIGKGRGAGNTIKSTGGLQSTKAKRASTKKTDLGSKGLKDKIADVRKKHTDFNRKSLEKSYKVDYKKAQSRKKAIDDAVTRTEKRAAKKASTKAKSAATRAKNKSLTKQDKAKLNKNEKARQARANKAVTKAKAEVDSIKGQLKAAKAAAKKSNPSILKQAAAKGKNPRTGTSTRSKNLATDKRLKSIGMTSAGSRTRTALSKRFSGTAKTKATAASRWTEGYYARSSQANLPKARLRKSTVRKKKK